MIHITDTNNNYPEFLPGNTFDFVLSAPVPPGFLLTGCLNEILVRDIDLTTSAIHFEIEDNPYFQIEYDENPCPAPGVKQFKARLRTSTFIRNFREPMTLTVIATASIFMYYFIKAEKQTGETERISTSKCYMLNKSNVHTQFSSNMEILVY